MTSCPEAMGWDSSVFWKKAVSLNLRQNEASWDLNLGEVSPVVDCGMRASLLGQWVESWRWTNSQHSKKSVSLPPRVENLKVKKVIKVSYLNQESRQCFECFSDSYAFEDFTYIRIFCISVYYGFMTCILDFMWKVCW